MEEALSKDSLCWGGAPIKDLNLKEATSKDSFCEGKHRRIIPCVRLVPTNEPLFVGGPKEGSLWEGDSHEREKEKKGRDTEKEKKHPGAQGSWRPIWEALGPPRGPGPEGLPWPGFS